MRIAWCTPFAPESRVGEYSSVVVAELRRRPGVDVEIFYPPGSGGRTVPDPGGELDEGWAEELRSHDVIFWHVGAVEGLGEMERFFRSGSGIAVLHDAALDPLIAPTAGSERSEKVDGLLLLRSALDGALGVVTHSRFGAEKVRQQYAGDVWVLPLPAFPEPGQPAQEYVRWTAGQYADGIVSIADQAGAIPRRRDLASELCRTLDRIGFGSEDSISDSVAAAAAELFGPEPRMAHEIFGT